MPRSSLALLRSFLSLLVLTSAAGCGLVIDAQPADDAASLPDAGARDSGGVVTRDGAIDAAQLADAGPPDSGSCLDEDGDGVTDCAGDCDDAAPTVYAGAPIICGDGVSNDCSGAGEDASCGGLGTFVSATRGDDSFPGTQAMPVATIAQGLANATTIGGGVDVYVAIGSYREPVTMIEGVSVYGSFDPNTWVRDATARSSTIENTAANGVTFPTGLTRATELEGFAIDGFDGFTASAITVQLGASPVIRGCAIKGPDSTGASHGIMINPANTPSTATPLIENVAITLGGARTGWGPDTGAWGVLAQRTAVEVRGCTIELSAHRTIQRGIELFDAPARALVIRNTVRSAGTSESAFGIRIGGGGGRVEGNVVHAGPCSAHCFGIALEGNLGSVVVVNNVAFAGDGTSIASAGFTISFEASPTAIPDVLVHSNFFMAGTPVSGVSSGAALVLERGTALSVGRFYDNILRAGPTLGSVAFSESSALIDPQLFHHNALFAPRLGAAVGRLYMDEGATPLASETEVNALPGALGNIEDDCGHLAPAPGSDLHLATGSVCIDAGDATEAPAIDFEDDPRPIGAAPDIGPDEHAL